MPTISYNELKANISSKEFHNIYFLQGEEYLIKYFEKSLKNTILQNNCNDFDLNLFNEENITLDKLTIAIETLPIQSSKKCIIIHNLPFETWNNEQIDNFIEIIKDIPEFVILIISQYYTAHSTAGIARFKKVEKALLKNAAVANFSKKDIPLEKQLIFWAKKYYQKNLSVDYANQIKEKCPNHSINALKNELKKICEFESSDYISKPSLNMIICDESKIKIFDLPKAIHSKNIKKSFGILNKLLKQKEEPMAILGVLANEYIELYRIKIFLKENKLLSEFKSLFNYHNKEFRIKNAQKICSNITLEQIEKCLNYIIKAELNLKSTQLSEILILSKLLIELTR